MDSDAVTHIAGVDITVSDRFMRQRCAWCDAVLLDYDLAKVAVANNPDGSPGGGPTPWSAGSLVSHEDSVWRSLPEGSALPDDFCGWATLATVGDFE